MNIFVILNKIYTNDVQVLVVRDNVSKLMILLYKPHVLNYGKKTIENGWILNENHTKIDGFEKKFI